MKNRFLTVLLSIIVLTSTLNPIAANANDDKFALLNQLGIDIKLDNPNEVLTRAELAKYAIQIANLSIVNSDEPRFSDVPKKHWAFILINTVATNGLMGASYDDCFLPDSNASVMDGGRVLIYLLGYDFGNEIGWTDSDYVNTIRSIGLTKGTEGSNLTYYTLAKMMLNMLETPMAGVKIISEGKAKYEPDEEITYLRHYVVDEEMTYLRHKYGFIMKKGYVEAVENANIDGCEPVGYGRIRIDGKVYRTGGLKCIEYLGCSIKYMVKDNSDAEEIFYIDSRDNTEDIVIPAEDIEEYKNRIMRYRDGEQIKKIEVSLNCQVFLNGTKLKSYNESDFTPIAGNIRCADKDDDGKYELIFIKSFLYFWVKNYAEEEIISDKVTNEKIMLNDVKVYCYKDSKEAKISDIKSESVIAVAPDELKYIDGFALPGEGITRLEVDILNPKRVEGQINEISGEGCKIGDTTYNFSKYFRKLIENKYITAPKINSNGSYFINEKNEIILASYTSVSSEINYGYLLGIGREGGSNLSVVPEFKLIDEGASAVILKGTKNFRLNGVKSKYESLIKDPRLVFEGKVIRQLISYKSDVDGNIKELYIAKDYVNPTIKDINGEDITNPDYNKHGYYGYDTENFSLNYQNAAMNYRYSLDLKYSFQDDALVFVIPSQPERLDRYKVTGKNIIAFDSTYPIKIYEANSDYKVGVAVIDSGMMATGLTKNLNINAWSGVTGFMIDEISKSIVDEEERMVLKGVSYECNKGIAGSMRRMNLIAAEDDLEDADAKYNAGYRGTKWNDLKPGDVIHYEFDDSGAVERFRVVFRYKDLYDVNNNLDCRVLAGTPSATMYMVCARIERTLSDGSFIFNINKEGGVNGIFVGRNEKTASFGNSSDEGNKRFKVFIYDSVREKVLMGSSNDIREGDAAYVRCESGELIEVFIYR